MEAAADRIAAYHNLFTGCMAAVLFFLILAAVLFFLLNIRNVLGYLTGSSRKKKIKELEKASAAERHRVSEPYCLSFQEEAGATVRLKKSAGAGQFLIEREIICIHTDEKIEGGNGDETQKICKKDKTVSDFGGYGDAVYGRMAEM